MIDEWDLKYALSPGTASKRMAVAASKDWDPQVWNQRAGPSAHAAYRQTIAAIQ